MLKYVKYPCFIHPRWLAGFLPSTVPSPLPEKKNIIGWSSCETSRVYWKTCAKSNVFITHPSKDKKHVLICIIVYLYTWIYKCIIYIWYIKYIYISLTNMYTEYIRSIPNGWRKHICWGRPGSSATQFDQPMQPHKAGQLQKTMMKSHSPKDWQFAPLRKTLRLEDKRFLVFFVFFFFGFSLFSGANCWFWKVYT